MLETGRNPRKPGRHSHVRTFSAIGWNGTDWGEYREWPPPHTLWGVSQVPVNIVYVIFKCVMYILIIELVPAVHAHGHGIIIIVCGMYVSILASGHKMDARYKYCTSCLYSTEEGGGGKS